MNEKKDLNKKEMTEEELNKVAGGTWYAHDTAKVEDLLKRWDWARVVLYKALNQAKSSGDPVAIQKAQEAYDAVEKDKNMWQLCELWDQKFHDDQEKAVNREAVKKLMETMGYQHYMDWFNSIIG